jgi:Zn-dependent peptidase ImmA (M78 family)
MQVYLDRGQPQRGRAQRIAGRKQIYLRPEPTEERHQWTVAHEIGEHFKADLLHRLGIEPRETRAMSGESLANLFAYHLLVPTIWFRDDATAFAFDLLTLKSRYRTASHEVIAWRFLDLPSPCIVTIVDNDRISRRRSNSYPIRRQLHPVERKCQKYVNRTGETATMNERGWFVQCWPVHQIEWKREILRSVVDDVYIGV